MSEAALQARKVTLRAPAARDQISTLVHAPIGFSEEELQLFLQSNNVDTSKFGSDGAATWKAFSDELVKGEAQLHRKPDGSLTRLVDVVILEISRANGDVLVEVHPAGGRLPAVKRRPDENPFWAAKRVLARSLRISENLVRLRENDACLIVEESESKAYPGLSTIYRRLVIPATAEED